VDDPIEDIVIDGADDGGAPADDPETMRYHIVDNGGNKRPQADVTVTVDSPGPCSTVLVSVLALNTEE
jgi:hypothetical protein